MSESGPSAPKIKKKAKGQRYRAEYSIEYPCLIKSTKESCVFCTYCKQDVSVLHGGRDDCKRHVESKKHESNANLQNSNSNLLSFFEKRESPMELQVTNAETLFTHFIIEHNVPIAVSDHAGPLFRKMFPDTEIAKKYGCARTKTSAIIDNLSRDKIETIVETLQKTFFACATDGSNDVNTQLYPIVVRYYNKEIDQIMTALLSMPSCNESCTGENIFNLLNREFVKYNIPWGNCVSFGCDNASVMTGKHKGVAKFVADQNENIYISGCPCHLVHIAAQKAAQKIPIKFEDLLVDIYYYLDKSSKRNLELKNCQLMCEIKTHKILKHVSTRWLSLGKCLERLLEQWDALKMFFEQEYEIEKKKKEKQKLASEKKEKKNASSTVTSEKTDKNEEKQKTDKRKDKSKTESRPSGSKTNTVTVSKPSNPSTFMARQASNDKTSKPKQKEVILPSRVERVHRLLSSPKTKLYCLFLKQTIPLFDSFNTFLQSDKPLIYVLRREILALLTDLYTRFVKPSSITFTSNLLKVNYTERKNQKNREDLTIGAETRIHLRLVKLTSEEETTFYQSIREFFMAACDYIIKKLPVNDPLLHHAEVADVKVRSNQKFCSVEYFIDKLSMALVSDTASDKNSMKDQLEVQFAHYQIENLSPDITEAERIDITWNMIAKIKGTDGKPKYSELSKLMLGILVIPHSNADSERIFSQVRKNRTETRPNLSVSTLSSLMVVKTYMTSTDKKCYEHTYTPKQLKSAKSATYQALQN